MSPESRARMDWQLALNTLLPRDIRIADAVLVPDTFHAQHSAVRKTYEYRLWLSKRYTPPQLFPFVWACGPVDVERMDKGSRYLLGKRDFASLKTPGRISAQRCVPSCPSPAPPRARSPKAASN